MKKGDSYNYTWYNIPNSLYSKITRNGMIRILRKKIFGDQFKKYSKNVKASLLVIKLKQYGKNRKCVQSTSN
jgi:hypothetical protein